MKRIGLALILALTGVAPAKDSDQYKEQAQCVERVMKLNLPYPKRKALEEFPRTVYKAVAIPNFADEDADRFRSALKDEERKEFDEGLKRYGGTPGQFMNEMYFHSVSLGKKCDLAHLPGRIESSTQDVVGAKAFGKLEDKLKGNNFPDFVGVVSIDVEIGMYLAVYDKEGRHLSELQYLID